MTIMHSSKVLMEDIYVNSTSHSGNPARNTDGLDTLFSDNITLRRWLVDNGDDGISLKANSTNVVLEDSILRRGQGFALGSIGQYKGAFETIENVTVRNVSMINTNFAVNVKTWTGDQVNYPPNGGGGGLGCKWADLWYTIVGWFWLTYFIRDRHQERHDPGHHFDRGAEFCRQHRTVHRI